MVTDLVDVTMMNPGSLLYTEVVRDGRTIKHHGTTDSTYRIFPGDLVIFWYNVSAGTCSILLFVSCSPDIMALRTCDVRL